jgi:beta-lactamase superfamily II metal-dependent hydrolase
MKPIIQLFWIIGFLVFGAINTEGQYLQVSRQANIKESYNGNSPTLEKANKGDYYVMVKEASDSTNSYYKVKCNTKDQDGWIYRTLVRRYEGNIPGKEVSSLSDLVIDVVDVGAGLCNVIKLPDGRYIIYDAGNYTASGNATLEQIKKIIPVGSTVELMILSHTDSDHVGAASNIIENYRVKKILHTGYEKSLVFPGETMSSTYKRFQSALKNADYPIEVVNLYEKDSVIKPGITESYGNVKLIYLCGFGKPLEEWNPLAENEMINSVSIVVKVVYDGASVLLAGDAVGRHIDDPPNALIATEKYLVDKAPDLLNSDILVAPHHGADNGSSLAFIQKVTPDVVIFSAGHKFQHPRQITSERYLGYVKLENIFRTDRGDDEGGAEWDYKRVAGCVDPYGDDDVEILITSDGKYKVKYLFPEDVGDE